MLPSPKNPHFQNEAKCTTFLVKKSFICMRMKNHFHIKSCALNLVLIQRPWGTQKWPIVLPRPLLQSQKSLRKLTRPSFPLVSKVANETTCIPSKKVGWGSGRVVIYTLSEFYFLTIIPRARMGYWLRGHEGERNNCFNKIQLVGKKYRDKTTFSWLKLDVNPFLPPKSARFLLLVGYNI